MTSMTPARWVRAALLLLTVSVGGYLVWPTAAPLTHPSEDGIPPEPIRAPSDALAPNPTPKVSAPTPAPTLPPGTQKALSDLQATYHHQLAKAALEAEKAKREAELALAALNAPPPVRPDRPTSPPSPANAPPYTLRSVSLTPDGRKAWLAQGEVLLPVMEGVWLGELKVHRIEKHSVVLIDRTGREVTLNPRQRTPKETVDDQSRPLRTK